MAIVVLGGAVAGGLYWRWANSPRYALQQAALALQARDMDKFFNYIDLKEILSTFVETCGKDLETSADQPADEWNKVCRQLGSRFANVLLPKYDLPPSNPRYGGSWNVIYSTWTNPRC